MHEALKRMTLPESLRRLVEQAPAVKMPETRAEMFAWAMGAQEGGLFEVAFDVPGKGRVVEATVAKCRNGLVVNYPEPYMRRRDPDCLCIADDAPSDKPRFRDLYGVDFSGLRGETLRWLSGRGIILVPFMAGGPNCGYPAMLVVPDNAGFFAGALSDLQDFIPASKVPQGFAPIAVLYIAPTFRHTHFAGRQMVVHNRVAEAYEMFAYNLYPGPSAKKGVYGLLIEMGEREGWVTAHASGVKLITPYDNTLAIMHEGASGGGKSEMTEQMHRDMDGRILLSVNVVSGEKAYLKLAETCELRPVADDMALCHPRIQNGSSRLVIDDAEQGWFLRTDHIKRYGTDRWLEAQCVHPVEPLLFLNFDTVPGSTCLLFEHTMDAPGKPCPNPRVILPRRFVPGVAQAPVEIDIRSFGIRTPPCTREAPSYGILGLIHVLPPALAWLWRLVAPRGHDNPSVVGGGGMESEGVGSYWPFATGKQTAQANLLLEQMRVASGTRYILVPNQHVGAYQVGFMPQWIAREYLARRGGARFAPEQLRQSRCPLLGYALSGVKVEGTQLPRELLEVHRQSEVGEDGFQAGAAILAAFFKRELAKFNTPDLDPLGRAIIACCLHDGALEDYIKLMPMRM